MHHLKKIIAALIFINLCLSIYFFTRGPEKQLDVSSEIRGHGVTYKNKDFFMKKVDSIDFFKKVDIDRLVIVASDKPQQTVIDRRGTLGSGKVDIDQLAIVTSDKPQQTVIARRGTLGSGKVSLAYGLIRKNKTVIITLYVNPAMYPAADTAELERQYSQLALMALYQMAPIDEPKTPENLKKFLADYRDNMEKNTIFTVH